MAGIKLAKDALWYVAPVGEKDEFTAHLLSIVEPFLMSDNS